MASPPPPPGISIYAELLQNIRQVSVAASLSSPANASTAATVAPNGSTIRLRHDGLDASLALPARVAAPPSALPIPSAAPSSSLAWRLPLLLLAPGHQVRQEQHRSDLDAVPWPATALLPGGPVGCRGCGGLVVGVGRVRAWKDLPSENWAEMMEFWHCHKPGDHGHGHGGHGEADGRADEKSLAARGYGADSAISAQEGVGFVDLTSFLFSEGDCEGILYSLASGTGSTDRSALMEEEADDVRRTIHISCAGCEARLGYFNQRTSAVTLFKWQVSCTTKESATSLPSQLPPQPTVAECLSATLIATTSRSGSSKSLLVPIPEGGPASAPATATASLHLWTLNNTIRYSSTALADPTTPVPAMKLLYRTVGAAEADRMLDAVASDVQEVGGLPADAVAAVAAELEVGTALLPPAEREFRGWQVGLLRRWEGG
ncbi:nipped-B-like protein A [Phialemonium atrogriseum]|uniref:Nipped-B-like protein A n=1 Tax=Phialemonium atrogriseum TaxID=1093897 RepID=A0AAJ0BZ16_9PEZI|nr:nipped-B-like protein A [Phialemonium atrogriseum]KAK1764706.1 nipped-B-like protein A [Phialemonium atrogriseum]